MLNNINIFIQYFFSNLKKDFLIAYSYKGSFYGGYIMIIFNLMLMYYFINFINSDNSSNLFGYILIGLATSDVLLIISRSASSQITQYKNQGIYEELMQMPLNEHLITSSAIPYAILNSLIRVSIYLIFYYLFVGSFDINNSYLLLLTIVLLLISFIGISLIAAAITIIYFRGNAIVVLYVSLCTMFGGVLYPAKMLPFNLEFFSNLLSIKPGLEIIRQSLGFSNYDSIDIIYSLMSLSILSISYFLLGYYLVSYAINIAKIKATLSFY